MLQSIWTKTITAMTWGVMIIILTPQSNLAQRAFEIRNITNQKIIRIYGTPSNADSWGLNYLGTKNTLNQGESISVSLGKECLYDFKAELENGQIIEEININTCSSRLLTLTSDHSVNSVVSYDSQITGFFCDSSSGIPETKYQNSSGVAEVWIRWNSDFFVGSGYDPLTRCQIVSQRLETYRQRGELNYIGTGIMNGQNVICSAVQSGTCQGLIYTLKSNQDPVKTLQQFMDHRMGVAGATALYESEDHDVQPFFDIRPYLDPVSSNADSNNLVTPETSPELRDL
jgi:hypothetical protein